MPTYNSSSFVEETIKSIQKQTFSDWELIVTDDASTDNTCEIIRNLGRNDARIKLKSLSVNSGPAVARNNSISFARGSILAFCDSDDKWHPTKIEKQLDFMKRCKVPFSYTAYYIINEKNKLEGLKKVPSQTTFNSLLLRNHIGCLTVMLDLKVIGKTYMPPLLKRQDFAYWLLILKKHQLAMGINEPLAYYRIRKSSISRNKLSLLPYNWMVYRYLGFNCITSSCLLLIFCLIYLADKLTYLCSSRKNSLANS